MLFEDLQCGPIPAKCPTCDARVKLAGGITDQKSAIALKFAAALILGGLSLYGILTLWTVMGHLSVTLVLLVIALSLIPSGIFFAFANKFPKRTEVRCPRCQWHAQYVVVLKLADG